MFSKNFLFFNLLKKSFCVFLFFFFCLNIACFAAGDIDYPAFSSPVVDEVDLLSSSEREQILNTISQLKDYQLAVVILKDTRGLPTQEYTLKLANNWGVGKASKNNGVLFSIVPSAREVRIDTGYGTEEKLTDAMSGKILDDYVIPYFKEDNIPQGVLMGTQMIVNLLNYPQIANALIEQTANKKEISTQEKEQNIIDTAIPTKPFLLEDMKAALLKLFERIPYEPDPLADDDVVQDEGVRVIGTSIFCLILVLAAALVGKDAIKSKSIILGCVVLVLLSFAGFLMSFAFGFEVIAAMFILLIFSAFFYPGLMFLFFISPAFKTNIIPSNVKVGISNSKHSSRDDWSGSSHSSGGSFSGGGGGRFGGGGAGRKW